MRYAQWAREVAAYGRESATPNDFARLMRVRLSQSKAGPWVTPEPIVADVRLRTLGPTRLRSHTTDISVLAELLVGGSYAPLADVRDVHVVVDLGANTGLAYRWFRHRWPTARFVCVEPDPGNLEILRSHVDERCTVIPACIGGWERNVTLASGNGEWGFRMTDQPGSTPVVTMPQILESTGIDRIDILKCDIEGAEAELFGDCRGWIERVRAMVVECHLDKLSSSALIDLLAKQGASLRIVALEQNPEMGFELATFQT